MSKLLELLASLSSAGSMVVICILLLRLLPPHAFPAAWRYAIGKMALAFYLLPAAIGIQWLSSLSTSRTTTSATVMNASTQVPQAQPLPGFVPEPIVTEPTVSAHIVLLLLSLWGIGAVAFAGWQMFCYRKFSRQLQHTRTAIPDNNEAVAQLALIKETLGIRTNVRLAYSSAIRSPVLIGLWKPTIYLPVGHANVDLRMVIRHELIHLKQKDLWVKAMILAAGALHWFNPLVHLLRQEIHTWSELSCDEEVVKDMSPIERKRYGETILNVMIGSKGVPVRFCASLSGDGKRLKRRLTLMLNVKKPKTGTIALTAATLITLGVIGTSTAVWASNHIPEVETAPREVAGNPFVYKDVGDTVLHDGVQYLKFGALAPDEQTFVIDEELKGQIYALEGYEHPVPADELTPEEQRQVTLEEGFYSPGTIARIKEFREKFPRGETVTHTHEDDPSVPPGMSVTIRAMTPEEIAELEQRRVKHEKLRKSLLNWKRQAEYEKKQAENLKRID